MESPSLRSGLGGLPSSERWQTSKVLQKFKKAFSLKFQILPIFLHHIFMLSAFSPVKVFKKLGSVPVFTVFTFIFTIITVFPKDSNAMVPLLTDLVGLYQTPTQTNQNSTCGNCHNAWGGRETRNNIGVAYYIFDNNKVTNSSTSKLSLNDADRDGYNNYTEFTNSQTTIQPGATTRWFASFPDKDGDGCIALYYRTDENGMPVPQDEIKAQGCVNGNTCNGTTSATKGFNSFTPLGWDIDDNDPAQGCASWSPTTGPSPNPGTTSDNTAPGQITNLRYDGTTLASQSIPLTWTAVADDGTTGSNAHSYDMRYTTESLASVKTYCGGGTSNCNVRLASDWLIMWDQPDCDVDKSTGLYLAKSGTPGGGGAATASCGTSWNQGEIAPLMRALYEPVPATPGSPEIYTIQMQGDTLSGINSSVYPNTITNGITYWIAMRTSDGILIPKGNAGDGIVDDPTGFDEPTFSAVSNIVAVTAGTSTTGAAIQSYTATIGKSATSVVEVHGLGLGASGIITQGRLYDATLGTITCSIDGPSRTDIYLKLTCNTSAATNGQYDLDLLNASSVTKAAWVDGVQITDAATTTVDDNTDPSDKYPTGGEANLAVSAFNISTTSGTDTVTQIQITHSGTGSAADISAVKLWRDVDQNSEYSAGDVQIGGTQTFTLIGSDYVATFSSLSESVDAIDPPEKYIITFDIVASPTTEGTHYAEVSGFVSGMGNNIVETDNPDAVLAIDWTAPTTTASATGYTFDTWTNSGSVPVSLSGSDNVSGVASTTYCIDQTNTCTPTTSYTAAFNVTCATTCTQYVRYQSVDNSGNGETVKSSIVKQDLQGPTDGTLSASPGDSQVVLNWTAATDSGSGLATANTYKVVFQTGPTAPANCTVGTQIYLGTGLTYTHTSLTNTTQYSYRVCAYDAVGYSSTGATASATPVSTPQTIASNGVSATSNKYANGGETDLAVGTFELKTSSLTDTINQIVVSSAGTLADSNVASVRIFEDNGSTPYEYDATNTQVGTSQIFSAGTATFGPSLNISVSTTAKKYIIVYNIAASPSGNGTLQGSVSDITFTSINTKSLTDTTDGTITVDITAPTTTASATGYTFDTWTSSASVSVSLSASDGTGSGIASGYPKYCIDTTNTCSPTTTYTAAFDVTCAAGTNCTQYVRYQSVDNAGNTETPVKSSIVKQDLQSPTDGTLSASPGDSQVVLNWTNATDSGSNLATTNPYKVVYQQAATPPADCASGTQIYLGTGLTYTHTGLTNTLPYSYRVCAYDAVGNPPSTGATASATPAATPQTIASAGASAASNKYAKGGETDLAVGTFELKASSGIDTINQIVVSSAGSLANSNVARVRIFEDNGSTQYEYDTTDTEVGTFQTFSGSTATFGPSLNISVSTTAKKYIIVYNIAASPSGNGTLQGSVSDITFTSINTKSLTDTADGTITVDISLPTGTVNINSSAAYTNSTSVNLTLSCSDTGGSGCYQMQFSNDGASWSAWEAYNSAKSWTLSSGDGTKTVYVKFRDNALNESSSVTDTITLDTAAPSGTVTINNSGDAYTNSATVTLTLTCGDATSGCYQMKISNDGLFDTEAWEAFAGTKNSYNIGSGDGTKTVYVMFKDNALNETASATTDTIILDTAAPSVSSATPTGTGVSVSITVTANFTNGPINCSTVTNTGTDATSYFKLKRTSDSAWVNASVTSCTSTQAILTPSATLASNTQYTAYLTTGITDEAGNTLTAYNWSFTTQTVSDVTAPAWNSTTGVQYVGDSGTGSKLVLCFNGATDAASPPVSYFAYYNTASPASGGTSVSIGSSPATGDSASCGGSAYDYKYELTGLPDGNGTKYYITVRARDNVGNFTTNDESTVGIPYNRTLSVLGYNMISVPGELGAGLSTSIFGDDLSYVRVMGWNGSYVITSTVEEGKGYWILNNTSDPAIKIDIDSTSGDNGSYTAYTPQGNTYVAGATVGPIAVIKGWNLIGNPCLTNITGSIVSNNITVTLSASSAFCDGTSTCSFAQAVTGNFVRNTVYRWNGNNYTTDAPQLTVDEPAQPWASYWLYVYNTTPYATSITITCGAQ